MHDRDFASSLLFELDTIDHLTPALPWARLLL
jgi:hypothetical protein